MKPTKEEVIKAMQDSFKTDDGKPDYHDLADAVMKLYEEKFERLTEIRNELYDSLPTGKIDAFDLIKSIDNHINKLDAEIQ